LVISHAPTGTGAAMVVNDGATLVDSGSVPISTANLILGNITGCTNTFTGVNSTTTAPIATTTLNASGTTVINVTGVSSVGVYPLISFASNVGMGNFVVGTLPSGVAANIVTNNGTNIALNVTSTGTPYVWKGNVNNNWNIGATANWFLNNSTVYSDGSLVRFDDTASLFNVNVAANVAPGGTTVTNALNAYTFSGTNNIGGSGSLTKTGTNNLTIAVNNYTASGGIVVNGGTLTVGDGNTNGAVTASAIVDNSAVEFNRADTNGTFSGGISGSGTVTVNANTNGIFVLGGNNSYLGNTIIQSGTVKVGSSAALPFAAGDGILVVNQAGVLNVNADLVTLNGLSGTGTVDNQTTFGDANHNGLNFTVGANDTNSTFAGSLTNTIGLLNLNKIGNGTLSLTGTNYNTGMWIFGSGILNAASFSDYSDAGTPNSGPCAVGNRPFSLESANNNNIGLWFEGGTLQYTGSTPQTTDRMIRLVNGNAGAIDASGSNPGATLQFTWNDASLNFFYNGGTRTLRLTGSNTGVNVMSMHIYDQGASPTSILKDGAGTWYLTNSVVGQDPIGSLDNNGNSYTGTTTVSNGVLYVSTGSGDVAVASPVGNGAAGPALGTIGGSAYTVYDGATLGMINLDNTYRVRGQSLTNNGSTTLRFGNVDSTTLPVSYFTNVAVNGTTTIALDGVAGLAAGNTYPLIQYGTFTGSFLLTPLSGGIYGKLTNDTANSWIALVVSSTPFVNTTPTNITTSVISNGGGGQSLVLSWPADHTGWTLQTQTNSLSKGLGTNWVDVPGSASVNIMTNPIVITNGTVFYRMKL